MNCITKIEVACFISILPDVSGAREGIKKENMPKGNIPEYIGLGRMVNNHTTVII